MKKVIFEVLQHVTIIFYKNESGDYPIIWFSINVIDFIE